MVWRMTNNHSTVIWYDKYAGLNGNMTSKARAFVKNNLIHRFNDKGRERWIIRPLKGNKTIYEVYFKGDMGFCECQFNRSGKICSHIMAVQLFEQNECIGGGL